MSESHPIPLLKEDHISQVPALQLLQNLGYEYLAPDEALAMRGGRTANVILEGVLTEQLGKINKVHYKGKSYAFSDANIQAAVQDLKNQLFEGLNRTNEKVYDLLTLGQSMAQLVEGDLKSFQINFVDWNNWQNNKFHVTEEFEVDRTASHEHRRPDIVLFVNGIPFCIIECKRHVDASGKEERDPLEAAIRQMNRYQEEKEIPRLFVFAQLLLAISMGDAKYGVTGTQMKFWSAWREDVDESALRTVVNTPLSSQAKGKLFSGRFRYVRAYFDELERACRESTVQDRALFNLARPERLLDLVLRFTVFDAGERKVARYQQYFTVKRITERIRQLGEDGRRRGGVVWHTQGSGKSLTMVMLAEAIAMEKLDRYKIVLVTDRVDLDDQLYKTFKHCGVEIEQAATGKDLVDLLATDKGRAIATVINKFQAAVSARGVCNDNPNIFVLVDEAHRTQYRSLHANMRRALPNACFIGFTGTPVKKSDRDTVEKFGGMIEPTYTIRTAVADKAVVPLLYEGRHVEQDVDGEAIDAWFTRVTATLTKEQATDLKKKFATRAPLNKAEQLVRMRAWDIGSHFRDTFQGKTPFKGQLVAPDRKTALKYKKYLDEFGMVSSDVLITGPDDREGEEDPHQETADEVKKFFVGVRSKYGTDKEYERQLINAFKHGDTPEIIIVVEKLTTGFDAPRNAVLYLCRKLEGHTLLQTIARVNRLYDGKDFGYIIDYCGVLQRLNEALDLYGSFDDFDEADVAGAVVDVNDEIARLPSTHDHLWDVFKGVANKRDQEAYERFLADDAIRIDFYERLRDFARAMSTCLGSSTFIEKTPADRVRKYKDDLKFFMTLRARVRRRYAEVVDFKEYEARIQKLIDAHVGANQVETLTPLVNIFDVDAFAAEVEKCETPGSKADFIANQTKHTIRERMDEDPAFYKKFSTMLEEAIAAFKAERISDLEYLRRVRAIHDHVAHHSGDDTPNEIRGSDTARSYYGILDESLPKANGDGGARRSMAVAVALGIDEVFARRRIVNWKSNRDRQNQMKTDIEDLILASAAEAGVQVPFETVDDMLELIMQVAMRKLPE
jgi:type I restriction enzyme, R subunit